MTEILSAGCVDLSSLSSCLNSSWEMSLFKKNKTKQNNISVQTESKPREVLVAGFRDR